MKRIIFYSIYFFCSLSAKAQTDSAFHLLRTINGDIVDFAVDNLDNVYLFNNTNQFRQLFGDAPSPQSIFDRDGYVYMYDSLKGVYVFDYYGTLKNKILITGWKDFRVTGKYIYGIINDTLQRYQINTFRLDNQKL